jgi:hypothetical protein
MEAAAADKLKNVPAWLPGPQQDAVKRLVCNTVFMPVETKALPVSYPNIHNA